MPISAEELAGQIGMKNLFTLDDLDDSAIHKLFELADIMEPFAQSRTFAPWFPVREVPAGFPPGTTAKPIEVFVAAFEHSLRTWNTFVTAAKGLHLDTREIIGIEQTSVPKGEGWGHTDTMLACHNLADIYCIRAKPEGAARYAAETIAKHHRIVGFDEPLQVPVLNMGDGRHGHPTQGLGDLLFLRDHFGQLEDLKVGVIGGEGLDLSRTAAELVRASGICGFTIKLFCKASSLPPENWLANARWELCESWDGIEGCDVLNWIRPQDERARDPLAFLQLMASVRFTSAVAAQCHPDVVHMHAQPIKDWLKDLLPVFPGMYDKPSFRTIQVQARRMVAIRMALLFTAWVNRALPTEIPEPPAVRLGPVKKMTMAEKRRDLDKKAKARKRAGEPDFWTPISSGTVIDHLDFDDAMLLHAWLLHKGIVSVKPEGVKAPIGPKRSTKVPGGAKAVVVLEGVFLDKRVMAALQLAFPRATFNVCNRGGFRKYVFPPERLFAARQGFLSPDGVLPCPSPECITNQCAQGQTGLQLYDSEGRLVCRFCERLFTGHDVHEAIKRVIAPTPREGLG